MREGRVVEIPTEDWVLFKNLTERLEHHVFGNGKPALESRLRDYIDERDRHKENNSMQALMDFKEEQDERHRQNQEKFDKLFQLGYIGLGIVITLQAFGLLHK